MKKYLFIILSLSIACIQETEEFQFYQDKITSSVIELNVQDVILDTIYAKVNVVTNIPRGGNRSETLSLIAPGRYYLNINIDRPTSCTLSLKNQYNIIVYPNDTTRIQINSLGETLKISFLGRGRGINEYFIDKKNKLEYTDLRYPINTKITSNSTYSSLKQIIDSIANQELVFLDTYLEFNDLPNWFLDFERSQITYTRDNFKTGLPHTNEILELFEDDLPEDYFGYLADVPVVNPKAILSPHYLWFLDSYFTLDLPVDSFNNLGGKSRVSLILSHELKRSKNELNGTVKDIYHRYKFSSIIRYYQDSLAIDSIAKEFELTDYNGIVAAAGTKMKSSAKGLNLIKGDTIPNLFLVDELDSLISIRKYTDKIIYVNIWATWCGPCIKNIPELNKLISYYENDSRITFINICYNSKKKNWLTSISRHNLKGINLFTEGNWHSKLKSIFNINGIPHYAIINKGNVLYENYSSKAPSVQVKLDELLSNTTPNNGFSKK